MQNINEFLDNDEQKDLLRILTAGSVDDGKSTLIGRLLYDSKKLYEDQLVALHNDSKKVGNAGDNIDYALLLDGLKAEREQGITIDVAYRYFSTNSRKFIIADTPGHEQYTRNMITGGSTASLAIILIDARKGVITQTKRHSFLISLLGIKNVVLAVNKMDLMEYKQEVFDSIVSEYMEFVKDMGIEVIYPIPLSALNGDNVVDLSDLMSWYKGKSLLDYLQTIQVKNKYNHTSFRYPVQLVLRPNLDFRGFAGNITSGVVRKGDTLLSLPAGTRSRVKGIHVYDGEVEEAFAPQSVTITLEDEIDVSRGDMLVKPEDMPMVAHSVESMLVWMDETPMNRDNSYYIKHNTNLSKAKINEIEYKVDVNTLVKSEVENLTLNEIGKVTITANKPLFFDAYQDNKSTGSFILIDAVTNNTVAVGMITGKSNKESIYTQESVGKTIFADNKESAEHEHSNIVSRGNSAVIFDDLKYGTLENVMNTAELLNHNAVDVIIIKSIYE